MRLINKSALLLGLTAGVISFGAQSAHAQFSGCGTTFGQGNLSDITPGFSCLIGDKLYSDFDFDLPGTTMISISENFGTQHTLTISNAATFVGATKFNYKITATNAPAFELKTWQTDTLGAVGANQYNVDVDWTNDALAPISLSLSPGPSSSFPPLRDFNPNTADTVVTHAITNGQSLTGITDTVTQTPGPLPLLGAGAAFGFSRKLRNRIKASA